MSKQIRLYKGRSLKDKQVMENVNGFMLVLMIVKATDIRSVDNCYPEQTPINIWEITFLMGGIVFT